MQNSRVTSTILQMLTLHLLIKREGITRMVNISKIVKICTTCAMLFIISMCTGDDEDYIPDVPVFLELSLTNELLELGVGETASIVPDTIHTESSYVVYPNIKIRPFSIPWKVYGKGLIIYRFDFSIYLIYDRTCTYKPSEQYCGVEISKTNSLIAVCPCCSSRFMLTADAFPTNDSKAIRSLMEYRGMVIDNGLRLKITK